MKVALVHDWLTGMRGGERCLEIFCELFPDAEIYTLLHINGAVSPTIEQHRIRTSFIQRLPFASTHYRNLLPIFPFAIQSFKLDKYDLVLSSSHCVAKGIRVADATCHIAYVHTPMRYIWDQYESYFGKGQAGLLTRTIMTWLRHPLQNWDVASSDGVHFFVANSQHVAERIQKYYRRQAQVVYPPVDFHAFSFSSHDEGFYLMVTAFAPYKRVDLAIQACNRLGRSLKIVGAGQDERRLLRMAGPTIEMLGWQSDQRIRECYARCKALIFPGEEDFGIVPLEVMASGKPVIAYAKGGALETVVPLNPSRERKMPSDQGAPTGIFFYEQTVEALIEAILLFERDGDSFDAELIRCHVSSFDRTQFKERMRELINRCYKEFHVNRSC